MLDRFIRILIPDRPFGLVFRQAGERRPDPVGNGISPLFLPPRVGIWLEGYRPYAGNNEHGILIRPVHFARMALASCSK